MPHGTPVLESLAAIPFFGGLEADALERLARAKGQRDEGAATRRLLLALPIHPPFPGKGGNPAVGTGEAERHKVGMELLQRPALLA